MIVLNDLIVKESKLITTEHGEEEIPGGLFAEFSVDEEDDVLVPINEGTFNALMDVMTKNDPIVKH